MAADDEFAEQLQALKDRSGYSFEALGRRTGTSESTLHRYCRGKGLPSSFGLAERIAKACGADHDELLELHRRWVLADAARAGAHNAFVMSTGTTSTGRPPVQEALMKPIRSGREA